MPFRQILPSSALVLATLGSPALAERMEANCTGMLDLDIYVIDTALPEQQIEGIGLAQVDANAERIVVSGAFGEWNFDLVAGTLYRDGRDSGIYCTWSKARP